VTTLSIWTYPDADGARRLEQCVARGAAGDIVVRDGALAIWTPGRAAPRVRELQGVPRTDNLGTAFWGLLLGIVVAGPELADLGGGTHRALDGSLSGVGIDHELLAELRRGLRPGCSALAVVADSAVADEIHAASAGQVAGPGGVGIPDRALRRLTSDQEAALHRVFSA
jgi:uncharacterized membrane protein